MIVKSFLATVSTIVLLMFSLNVSAQKISSSIQTIIDSVASFKNNMPEEQAFLHIDRPYYSLGDTLYLKAYLLNTELKPSPLSGLLYLEFIDDKQNIIKRVIVPYVKGIMSTGILLDETDFKEGNYTIRAFTNWMRNFNEQNIFKKAIFIGKPDQSKTWLVKSNLSHKHKEGQTDLNLQLAMSKLDNSPVSLKDLKINILSGKKVIHSENLQTKADGTLTLQFSLADKTTTNDLSFYAEEVTNQKSKEKISFPLAINRPSDIDLQFMPEAGNLVTGINSKLAFKAINEDGTGVNIEGKIMDGNGKDITTFKSSHAGMGAFEFSPQAGQKYTASITSNGATVTYPLPEIKISGTAMKIDNMKDSLQITITASDDIGSQKKPYYLVGYSRGVVCLAARILLKNNTFNLTVPKSNFPTGITRFTLLSDTYLPLNERIVYINNQDQLQVNIIQNKPDYKSRDSIALDITVTDLEGKPIQGSFSLAVTDDKQVKADSTTNSNLMSYMLLEAQLKGNIENPGYYITRTSDTQSALDLLLLTQGWINYDWNQVLGIRKKPTFLPEPDLAARGKVTNVLNKGLSGLDVNLFSMKPHFIRQTTTDSKGYFIFEHLPLLDSPSYYLQTKNKKGMSYNVGIEMDEFIPLTSKLYPPESKPWFYNSDSISLNYAKTNLNKIDYIQKAAGVNMLKEVNINAVKAVRNSKNLNGPGIADQVLDEEDIRKAGKMTLEELLMKKINGFMVREVAIRSKFKGVSSGPDQSTYTGNLSRRDLPPDIGGLDYHVKHKKVHFVFDGIFLDQFYEPPGMSVNPHYNFSKSYLDHYLAEDILGVEILLVKNHPYLLKFGLSNAAFPPDPLDPRVNAADNTEAYIEITTRFGKGPFQKNTPGKLTFSPPPFALPRTFYRPKYTSKTTTIPDFRSTIHWEPAVITGADGKAKVSFYAADKPSKYTIILQGIGTEGQLGYVNQKITFKP